MGFEKSYTEFIEFHQTSRKGERLRRLLEGHGHAERLFLENVWWPSFQEFSALHPEFEVQDFKGGFRYLDFAFIRPSFKLVIEIDGYGPHWRNLNRWQFSDQLNRQNHLVIDGWKLLRFSYDDIKDSPRLCQQTVQQMMGRLLGDKYPVDKTTALEKEIIRLAIRKGHPITPQDVQRHLSLDIKTSRKFLHSLVQKKWLVAASGKARIRSYQLMDGRDFTL